ncbi:MAG: sodium:solute symporter [Verrucomicrobiales bacterium]
MSEYLLDIIVIITYFVVIIGIGLYAARGQKSMETFALGNRSMPWWAVLASILAAEISAATFLGAPDEGYKKLAYTYALLVIGTILARLIVAGVFIRPFYEMKVVSIYEYLEHRFGILTKRLASFVFLLTRSLASGSRLYVAAILIVLAYEAMHGLKLDPLVSGDRATLFWFYFWAVIGVTALTTLYTALGGIKAVVWTDLIQITLMFSAAAYVFFWLWGKTGGADAIGSVLRQPIFWDFGFAKNADGGMAAGLWPHVKNILSSEYTVWAAFLGSVFTTMATHGTDQDMVQRMLTATDQRKSRWAVIGSGLVDLPIVLGFLTIGIMLHLYFTKVDPGGLPAGKDAFPWFIIHDLSPGLRGLLTAGLFATAMGSLSTALNALATSFTRDWYLGLWKPSASEKEQLVVARWSTVGFAIVLAAVGIGTAALKLANPDLRIIPIVLGSFGYTYGSLLGVFLLGMLTKTRGNCRGNLIAMASGFIAVGILSGAHNDLHDIFLEKEARVRKAVVELRAAEAKADFHGERLAFPSFTGPEMVLTDAQITGLSKKTRLGPEEVAAAWTHSNAHRPWFQSDKLPVLAFTWRIMVGSLVTMAVGACFPSTNRRKETA